MPCAIASEVLWLSISDGFHPDACAHKALVNIAHVPKEMYAFLLAVPPRQQPVKVGLAHRQRQLAEILAVAH